jgi:hypothetical protein
VNIEDKLDSTLLITSLLMLLKKSLLYKKKSIIIIKKLEIKMINSGKADFPRLLNKRKLPKIPRMVHCPGLETKNEEYYTPKDLILGNYINIYNRKCLIVSCDEFTKNWYKEK